MKSILIQSGDIVINSKRLQLVEGDQQKYQRTKATVQIVKGELFYNANLGLNYDIVLGITDKSVSDEEKKLAIREAVFQDSNVNKINDITLNFDKTSRKLSADLQLTYKDSTETTMIGGVTIG